MDFKQLVIIGNQKEQIPYGKITSLHTVLTEPACKDQKSERASSRWQNGWFAYLLNQLVKIRNQKEQVPDGRMAGLFTCSTSL